MSPLWAAPLALLIVAAGVALWASRQLSTTARALNQELVTLRGLRRETRLVGEALDRPELHAARAPVVTRRPQ